MAAGVRAYHGRVHRIAVFGPSGSGKTTASRQIGRVLDLPVVELDALSRRPNRQPTPVDEFRAKLERALVERSESRVCDGNDAMVRPLALASADTVAWLRLPLPPVYAPLIQTNGGQRLAETRGSGVSGVG